MSSAEQIDHVFNKNTNTVRAAALLSGIQKVTNKLKDINKYNENLWIGFVLFLYVFLRAKPNGTIMKPFWILKNAALFYKKFSPHCKLKNNENM